jgi:hypothetical protein
VCSFFVVAVNETVIRTAADRLVELGLADAGYTYLNIDGEQQQQPYNSSLPQRRW